MADNPIDQFKISKILDLQVGGFDFSFTNSALFMVATVGVTAAFLVMTTSGRGLIPNKLQSISEMLYEFVANMLRDAAGHEGMKFFPLVFSLFTFILVANLFGMFPYFFTFTSHIVVTAAMAFLVIGTVIFYGFYKNGIGFLKLFVPDGSARRAGADRGADRGHLVPVAPDFTLRASVRQRIGRTHHAEGVCRFRHVPRLARLSRYRRCSPAARVYRGADRPRISRRISAGLRLCDPDLHVYQRRDPSLPLMPPRIGRNPFHFQAS